jgi:hypothetical protein
MIPKIPIDSFIHYDKYKELTELHEHIYHFNFTQEVDILSILKTPPEHKFILITTGIDGNLLSIIQKVGYKLPDNLIRWYSVYANFNIRKIVNLPLGWNSKLFENMKGIIQNVLEDDSIKKQRLMLMALGNTHPIRGRIKNIFSNQKWVSHQECNIPLEYYLILMKHHHFNISPRGVSEDSFRIWESLYFGIIPIVIKGEIYKNFTDLPILQLDKWTDITEELLNKTLEEFTTREWNYEKLDFNYWKNIMIEDIKNLD